MEDLVALDSTFIITLYFKEGGLVRGFGRVDCPDELCDNNNLVQSVIKERNDEDPI